MSKTFWDLLKILTFLFHSLYTRQDETQGQFLSGEVQV